MQTSRRYDPTKDAKFHVSIATTEAIRRKWATPLESLHRPKPVASAAEAPRGLSAAGGAPDVPTASKNLKTSKVSNAQKGLSPVLEKRGTVPLVAARGLSESDSAPDVPTVSKNLKTTMAGAAPEGLSPVFEKRGMVPLSPEVTPRPRSATSASEALPYAPHARARARLPGG